MRKKTYSMLGYLMLGATTLAGCCIYFWWMLLKPILLAVQAFNAGMLTGTMILKTLACCFLGVIPACAVAGLGFLMAAIIMNYGEEHGK